MVRVVTVEIKKTYIFSIPMSFELSVDMEAPSNAQKKIHFKTVYGKALKTTKTEDQTPQDNRILYADRNRVVLN